MDTWSVGITTITARAFEETLQTEGFEPEIDDSQSSEPTRQIGLLERILLAIALVFGLILSGQLDARARSRPLRELPSDVSRWSTTWMAIPQQVAEVGREHGPLAAMTWGPAKGTARFVRSTVEEVWDAAKLDHQSDGRAANPWPTGPIIQYKF